MTFPLFCVDAFTSRPFSGNPAAVVILDQEAPEEWMQVVAAEMNLSETTYAVKNGPGDYGLRWFTPTREVDLCGHATLAAAFVLWEENLETAEKITFHTKSGPLTAIRTGGKISLDFPMIDLAPAPAPAGLLAALGLPKDLPVQKGLYMLVELDSEDAVRAVAPDFASLKKVDALGVIVTAKGSDAGADFVSRMFAPAAGIDEDPVTGSAHCQLAPYWAGRLGKKSFFAKQVSRRGGQLHVRLSGEGRVTLQGMAALAWKGAIAKP
ncbi:MAG: PhzF family phenazine biosynthesis protein [Nitrospinota bacterium]|nr:PhzF family phenazine biosynthesis protein [Nitrospinota bacterium]